jgi:hypothetical protein
MKIYKRLEKTLDQIKILNSRAFIDDDLIITSEHLETLNQILCMLYIGYGGRDKFKYLDKRHQEGVMEDLFQKKLFKQLKLKHPEKFKFLPGELGENPPF